MWIGALLYSLAMSAVRRIRGIREQADEARGDKWWAEYQASKASRPTKSRASVSSGSQAGGTEGWNPDPYGRHEARWYSAGRPTALVSDDGQDGQDPLPGGTPPNTPESVSTASPLNAAAIRPNAADVAESSASPAAGTDMGQNAVVGSDERRGTSPSTSKRIVVGVLVSVVSLGVVGLINGQWGPWKSHGPTTTTTFNERADISAAKFETASRAVAAGCGAIDQLSSEFTRDEARGTPVPSSTSGGQGALDEVERIEQAASVPQYAQIVTATGVFTSDAKAETGSQGWFFVTPALNAVAAQCQLLGEPTGASGSSSS